LPAGCREDASLLPRRPEAPGEHGRGVGDTIASVRAFYRTHTARSRALVVRAVDLDAVGINPRLLEREVTMGWALVHMIEETARHAGHADVTRETIDGRTGG
jgi:hypothetical protein